MKSMKLLTFVVACLVTMTVTIAEAQRIPAACRAKQTAFKNAQQKERKALSDLAREERTLASLARRLERDIEKRERKAQTCQDRVDRKSDNNERRLNALEDQRRRYLSQIAELTVQRIACELEALTGRACDPNRFYTQIARLSRTVTQVETRIPALRNQLNRELDSERAKCAREDARLALTVARSQQRVDRQTPRVTARTQAATTMTAAREAAEGQIMACLAANPG